MVLEGMNCMIIDMRDFSKKINEKFKLDLLVFKI